MSSRKSTRFDAVIIYSKNLLKFFLIIFFLNVLINHNLHHFLDISQSSPFHEPIIAIFIIDHNLDNLLNQPKQSSFPELIVPIMINSLANHHNLVFLLLLKKVANYLFKPSCSFNEAKAQIVNFFKRLRMGKYAKNSKEKLTLAEKNDIIRFLFFVFFLCFFFQFINANPVAKSNWDKNLSKSKYQRR